MNDAVKLARAQMTLGTECLENLQAIKKALQENSNGKGVAHAVQAMEPALSRLGRLEKLKADFLAKSGKKHLAAYAAAIPDSEERAVVMRQLHELREMEERLQKELAATQALLKRSKEFVDFHINVMTQTAANDTYAPPGASEVENRRGIKMFDANV